MGGGSGHSAAWSDPSVAEQAAAFGLVLEPNPEHPPEPDPPLIVWPEHQHAVQAFGLCREQLRAGPRGYLVLDRAFVLQVLELLRLKPRRRLAVLRQLAVMEQVLIPWANDGR